jgi:hypothetical protein
MARHIRIFSLIDQSLTYATLLSRRPLAYLHVAPILSHRKHWGLTPSHFSRLSLHLSQAIESLGVEILAVGLPVPGARDIAIFDSGSMVSECRS